MISDSFEDGRLVNVRIAMRFFLNHLFKLNKGPEMQGF